VFEQKGCGLCHTVRGTRALATVGPDLTHVGGRAEIGATTAGRNNGPIAAPMPRPRAGGASACARRGRASSACSCWW